jgi:two-component system phosphate regulon sensor histidine kinase PhoR
VPRGRTYILLFLLMTAASAAVMVFGPGASHSLYGIGGHRLTAVGLFFAAGSCGFLAMWALWRSCRDLTAQLRDISSEGKLCPVETNHPDLTNLTHGINSVIWHSEKEIADAQLKAKEMEIQLKVATAERQHAEAIIYSISDAVLVTDPFDELVLANESAARAFDFDLEKSFRSTPVDRVLKDPKLIELIREMRQSDSAGRRIIEHSVKVPGGGERTFKITLSCVASDRRGAREPAGVVAVLHDITKEREVAEMKNDFVSNVSHELRTPLASIKAYVEMLIDGEATDEKTQREFYEVIQSESNRLGRLIDNILNISRIESGLVKVNKQKQSLTVIMKEAIEVITPQAMQKNIHIEEKLTPVFYQTMADKDMLYQSVLNLLSNAVKYTPEGGTITLETSVDESRKKVTGRISDTGVGIPPKDLPFVFDKFYRAEANNRMAKGTGLGLSLVKHIIEQVHGGRIFVESHVGKGSCFGFELDLCE